MFTTIGIRAGLICGALTSLCIGAIIGTSATAQTAIPDFSSNSVGWLAQGVNFQLPHMGRIRLRTIPRIPLNRHFPGGRSIWEMSDEMIRLYNWRKYL